MPVLINFKDKLLAVNTQVIQLGLVALVIAILLLVIAKRLSKINVYGKRNRFNRFSTSATSEPFFCKVQVLKSIYENMSARLDIYTGDNLKSRKTATNLIYTYFLTAISIFTICLSYARLWYVFLLNIIIALVFPYILVKLYVSQKVTKALKQLPDALDELEAALYERPKLSAAIDKSCLLMPSPINRSFEALSRGMKVDEREAIATFKKTMDSVYTDSLAVLLRSYIDNGNANLASQLQELNMMIRADMNSMILSASRLLKYKILAIATIFIIPIYIGIASLMSDEVIQYFTSSSNGILIITSTILSALLFYIFVEILERV